ncbi:MAG TPA: DUF1622 domain-containing protein [Methanosarcina vacuolata]|nr:DUF1622 domain-containing protein [Methanosarcina vacuolata]
MVFGLEFFIAADVLETVLNPSRGPAPCGT